MFGNGGDQWREGKKEGKRRRDWRMSDNHSDVGAEEEREADPGNVSDDGEVELNLPREVMEEQDRPREDIRESPGATASSTTAMSQEENTGYKIFISQFHYLYISNNNTLTTLYWYTCGNGGGGEQHNHIKVVFLRPPDKIKTTYIDTGGRQRKLSWSLNSSHYVFKNVYLTVHICNYYGMNWINIFVFVVFVFTERQKTNI